MRVLCFGDSNTYGYNPCSFFGGRYPAADRWVDLLTQKTGWEIFNAGQNGREIPRYPHELTQFNQLLSEYAPVDILVIMLGDNDLLQGASLEEVLSRMEAFLTEFLTSVERIVLIAPPPMKYGQWVTEDKLIVSSVQLAKRYKALAGKLGIYFADAGLWDIDLTFDGVHFSEFGHKAFAEQIFHTLTSQF